MGSKPVRVWVTRLAAKKFLYFQWVDPTTGRNKFRSSGTDKKREAQRLALELENQFNARIPTGTGSLSFGDFIEIYETEHLESLALRSHKKALCVLSSVESRMNPQTLADVTATAISKYAADLRKPHKILHRKTLLACSETTISGHLRTLKAALTWAKDNGHISSVPAFPRLASVRRQRPKGRPLTTTEFVKMLRATKTVVGNAAARSWRHFLRGLWLSGLRLEESLLLTWQRDGSHESALWIDTSGPYPLLGICADSEKGKTDRLLPLTPDFCKWVMRTPNKTGLVFQPQKVRYRDVRNSNAVSKVISMIGQASGVTVSFTGKFASAHDLRRSFGLRWSQKVMPAELQQLMRHSDIQTTMSYYVTVDALTFAKKLWDDG